MRALLWAFVAAMLAIGTYLLVWDNFDSPVSAALKPDSGAEVRSGTADHVSSQPAAASSPRQEAPHDVAQAEKAAIERQYQSALTARECFSARDFLEEVESGRAVIKNDTPSRDKLQTLINKRQTVCAGVTLHDEDDLTPIFRAAAQAGIKDAAALYAQQALIQAQHEEVLPNGRFSIRRNYEALPKDLVPLLNAAVDRGEESAIYLLQSYYLGHPTEGWRYGALLLVARDLEESSGMTDEQLRSHQVFTRGVEKSLEARSSPEDWKKSMDYVKEMKARWGQSTR